MRKGVSDIIGVAIIMAIGVSLAGLYSSWAPEFAENNTQKIADSSNQQIKCRNAAISIQDPVYDKSSNLTLFDLANSGTIRFSETIKIASLNSSVIMNQTTVSNLEVGETIEKQIYSTRSPDTLLVASRDCPSLSERETVIKVQN